jgi:hypothetical protein
MIALPARYRKGPVDARNRESRGRPKFAAGHDLTNTSAKIIMPPHFSQAHAPEDCDKGRS